MRRIQTRLTKIKGSGKIPDGFFVIGDGEVPMADSGIMISKVKSCSHPWRIQSDWFVSGTIQRSFKMDWGYLYACNGSLWAWDEVIDDHGKWIRD